MSHEFEPNTLVAYEASRCRARATFAALLHAMAYCLAVDRSHCCRGPLSHGRSRSEV